MYYPYLRAKQFELKALRDFFQQYPDEKKIIPILEPVNESTTALQTTLTFFESHGKKYAVVVNPKRGAFEHSSVVFDISRDFPQLVSSNYYVPAFIVENDIEEVAKKLDEYPGGNVMLIFAKGADTDNPLIKKIVSSNKVDIVLCSFSLSSRRTKSYLINSNKKIVVFEDNFNEQKRNADYLNNVDEHFSETFRYYSDDGFHGFSDYTALPSSFTSEGMLPYALAIHLTYLIREDQINIHHFVSDSNRDQKNIQGKFFEAARKVVDFYNQGIYKTDSVNEIIKREGNKNDGFPGLGYLKKLSVKNHLELIHYLMGGNNGD